MAAGDRGRGLSLLEPISGQWVEATGTSDGALAAGLPAATLHRTLGLGVTGVVVKNAAGTLRGYAVFNNGSAARYVKVYNKATAPTEADTPAMTVLVPAGGGANLDAAGLAFAAGISLRATTGVADNDTGAPGATEVIVQVWYV